ncbi:helix-turn-helix domain-containing protein [Sciscionella marina]|uniref:helix-turn-helix domain-containing protein n=1 Tax=Sciscionella marina TaxID=508770 RepID=UPI00035F1E33|nr:AraC family transcriptional regulator [Sciscionella marina]
MDDPALPETCCAADESRIWIRPGQAAYLGPALRLGAHSGSVDCFALGLDADFTLCAEGIGERRARSALIPARQPHLLSAHGRMLFCYLDPGSAAAERIRERMSEHTSAARFGFSGERELIRRVRATGPRELFTNPDSARLDERIRVALRIMRADPANAPSADRLAQQVHLSSSRFLHLFSAHTGTSFRRYRLWNRMLCVAAAIEAGHDLTRASTVAGFASPGHFSDSFRAMFGLPASTLLAGRVRITVLEPGDPAS